MVFFTEIMVPSFDQSNPSHFLSQNHNSQNQMVYPQMQADVRSRSTSNTVEWSINAHVSGFELDLDPDIATFVFSLLDVYRLGISDLENLAEAVQTNDLGFPSGGASDEKPRSRSSVNTRTTHVLTSLEFQSGRVRLHHEKKQSTLVARKTSPPAPIASSPVSELSVDILLPVVSLWAEWRATPASSKGGSMTEEPPSSLLFKSKIHSSKNTVSPTILHFVSQILSKIETRLSKRMEVPPSKPIVNNPEGGDGYAPKALQAMSITFTLRIDQSTLDFTCQPDVAVRGGLHWESGGFVATATPGAKSIGFMGSVENLTAHLKHDYLSENCVEASIRDLSFSAALSTSRDNFGLAISRTSVAVETDLRANTSFSRLQDILCFKAVWFDSLSPLANQAVTPISPAITTSRESAISARSNVRRQWTTAVLIKVRRLDAQADLGATISKVSLTMEPLVFRTLLTERLSELFLSINNIELEANGLFSGNIVVPNCLFRTVRGRERTYDHSGNKQALLKIVLDSGQLRMKILYENKPVFLYE